jgi:hypothetical protein
MSDVLQVHEVLHRDHRQVTPAVGITNLYIEKIR